ncbi:MAG: DUF4743 domain-containing protein [Burkholderiales bacterium]|nr:DUF4743 domain-containing protein [Burkholderiales bacterium]
MLSATASRRIVERFRSALIRPSAPLVALRIEGSVAGRCSPARAARLAAFADVFTRDGDGSLRFVPGLATPGERSAALAGVARTLAAEDALTAWRDELYAAAPAFGAPAWFHLERAAARYFGIRTYAAHLNGLVRDATGVSMWVARRSPTKSIDPGMLDNLVGGGIAAGTGVARTAVKESWEEAGIPAPLASLARPTAILHVERTIPDGIQDEVVFVHDLWLPAAFAPANQDGEATEQQRLPLARVAANLVHEAGRAAMTVDASLVALTALVRETAVFGAAGRAALAALLAAASFPG